MKVIFLDVDGVLNSDEYFDKKIVKKIERIEDEIDIEEVKLLKKAVEETGAKVVITSSWRNKRKANNLKQLLREYEIFISDSTPNIANCMRGSEIKKWLEEHKDTEDFVILDDEIFKDYDEELLNKLIITSYDKDTMSVPKGFETFEKGRFVPVGLQQKHVEEIIQRLGRKRELENDEMEI